MRKVWEVVWGAFFCAAEVNGRSDSCEESEKETRLSAVLKNGCGWDMTITQEMSCHNGKRTDDIFKSRLFTVSYFWNGLLIMKDSKIRIFAKAFA